tara:strand:+ start:2996 stop:4030 length:1035 start_codon:yes stop_codon:yes gene_type:complete
MKNNNSQIVKKDIISSYNLARNCSKVFVESVTHEQYEQLKNSNSKIVSKNEILIVYKNTELEICENDIIFCHSSFIHELFYLLNKIDNLKNLKLVTTQSDVKITKKLFNAKPKCVSEWYSINVDYDHEKLIPIPLGIANDYSPKNLKTEDFLDVEKNLQKMEKIYCNFNPNTNNKERININKLFKNNELFEFDSPNLSLSEYLHKLTEYRFILSPWGNGYDTHRLWESLYSGSIPITKNHITYKSLSDKSVLFVDDYKEVNIELLNDFLKNYIPIDSSYLRTSFWIKKMNSSLLTSQSKTVIKESKLLTFYRIYEQLFFYKLESYLKKIKYYLGKIPKLLFKIS